MGHSNWKHTPEIATCASCGMQEALMGHARGWIFVGPKAYCSKDVCREVANLPPEPEETHDPEWDDEPRRQL